MKTEPGRVSLNHNPAFPRLGRGSDFPCRSVGEHEPRPPGSTSVKPQRSQIRFSIFSMVIRCLRPSSPYSTTAIRSGPCSATAGALTQARPGRHGWRELACTCIRRLTPSPGGLADGGGFGPFSPNLPWETARQDDTIRDLRSRLDREAEERRALMAILTDQSRRPWWRRWFR